MSHSNRQRVLISGASFAGLASAYWLRRAGYEVTLIELAPAFRKGGTPVNVKDGTLGVVECMGLLGAIESNALVTRIIEMWGADGLVARMAPEQNSANVEYEIERDVMTRLLFERIEHDVEVVFGTKVVRLQEEADGVRVEFSQGEPRTFELVLGCDGLHSNLRALWFGREAEYSRFLGAYGSVTIVPRLLFEPESVAFYQVPGRMLVLGTHHGKTDIITLFSAPERIAYDHGSRAAKIELLADHFGQDGWRIPELLSEIEQADNLYFSELAQIEMPTWAKGRVALVGDAAYCASPAAGKGGSLAIDGAAALGDAIAQHADDHGAAFRSYEASFRPFVEQVQTAAAEFCRGVAAGDPPQFD